MAGETIIETLLLTKYYGKTRGVENLSLSIEKGEIFGFLGPNGAGKTTSIRLLSGLLHPTKGRARIFGQDITKDSVTIREEIGYIPGDVRLYPKMTGEELLNFFASFKPNKPPVLKDELIKRFDLDLSRRVREYSKGMKQKLAVIVAFMHDPKLLILDEPTLGLDPLMQREFYNLLREFKEKGKTVFLSSHILSEVERVCDRVGIIRDGHLVATESVDEIREKKIRNVEVTFKEKVEDTVFNLEGVTVSGRHNHTLKLVVKGDIAPLVNKISSYKIEDLVIIPASLEEIFMEFYGKEANVD